ncbi:hypothetical protein FOA52_012509 [Chlamydomonas sp. UWO 241]|nr:hypothetical protein FOA52_012509 [Chlamydomonas sp. UWO 241]
MGVAILRARQEIPNPWSRTPKQLPTLSRYNLWAATAGAFQRPKLPSTSPSSQLAPAC